MAALGSNAQAVAVRAGQLFQYGRIPGAAGRRGVLLRADIGCEGWTLTAQHLERQARGNTPLRGRTPGSSALASELRPGERGRGPLSRYADLQDVPRGCPRLRFSGHA